MKHDLRPNFFIVGAAKAGTTSMDNYLGQHPEIFMCPVKESSYFIPGIGVASEGQYLSLFLQAKNEKIIGDASVGYLFSKTAARKIKEFSPSAKILISLRYPVDMAYSYWQYMQRDGNETDSFEKAISDRTLRKKKEFLRTRINWPYSYLYVDRAMYYEQVKRYIELFGKENVKVIIFEQFIKNPLLFCQEIFAFLNVNADFVPKILIRNRGGMPRSRFISKLLFIKSPLYQRLIPHAIRYKIRTLLLDLNTSSNKDNTLSPQLRSQYSELFSEDIDRLEFLLGRKLWVEKR